MGTGDRPSGVHNNIGGTKMSREEQNNSLGVESNGGLNSFLKDWRAYNLAQTKEGELFMQLLSELMQQVKFKPIKQKGRPFSYVPDLLFCCGMKLYTRMPARQLTSQLKIAKNLRYIGKTPHFNTVLNYLKDSRLTPILKELLTLSSLPLKCIESKFAVDATGFSTRQYERWFSPRAGYTLNRKQFVKAHAMCGVLTNIITSLEITEGHSHDSPEFPKLVSQTGEYFTMKEISADKAYSSRMNLKVVQQFKAFPYIPFRKNASAKQRGAYVWKKCLNLFQNNAEEFYRHYHLRSNIESTFSAIKRRFGVKLFTKNFTSQTNELYLKCICYNITVLIKCLFELNLNLDLNKCAEVVPAQKLTI